MIISKRIAEYRKASDLTQTQLAEKLDVSFQAVSNWERGTSYPDITRLEDIADALGVSVAALTDKEIGVAPGFGLNRFDTDKMLTYVSGYANAMGFSQAKKALAFAKKYHDGQHRDVEKTLSHMAHPLNMACHAMALNIASDDLVTMILLHDVNPDRIDFEINGRVKTAFEIYYADCDKDEYYRRLSDNSLAAMTKLLSRCNNISNMLYMFPESGIRRFIAETRQYILPLMQRAKAVYPEYNDAIFLIRYHIDSVMNNVSSLIK